MALALTSGGESRLDGAPDQMLPPYEDSVEALAQALLAEDEDGVYGGDINMAREAARMQLGEMNARSQSSRQAAAAAGAERNRMRAERQGVVPESLPMDEYGSVSARTVRDANLPLDEQEARQAQYDDLASDEIKAMREGRFHGAEAQARQYEQDYGLPTTRSKTGKTDLDYLREQQQHQGFIRTGRGEMIPMGPAPTPESLASRRDFDEWTNETPGSERQALYDPQAYEAHREGVREEIRNRAREEMAKFGTGVTDPEVREDLGLAPLTPEQEEARARRARSEDRVRYAQQGRFYDKKLEAETGMPAGTPEHIMEAERFRQRHAARTADLEARRGRVRENARLRNMGVPLAVQELPEADRAVAIRGLLPNRNAAVDVASAELGLKRDALEEQRAQRAQQHEAWLAHQERLANDAAAARDDAWKRFLAEQRAMDAGRTQAFEQWKAEQERAAQAQQNERDLRERDLAAREKEAAARDARERDLPGLTAEARAQVAREEAAAEAEREERERQQAMEMQRLQADIGTYGPGVQHIMEGRFDTPAADDSLRAIAAAADQNLGGFYQSDAVRMDAELFRLGITDARARHALVYRYGLGTAPGSTWRPSDVGGRDNILSALGMGIFGGPTFPER